MTGCIRFIREFPCESPEKKLLHCKALRYGRNVLFIPDQSNYVHIYDFVEDSVKSLEVFRYSESRYDFSDGVIINDILIILPGRGEQPILEVDLQNYKIRKVDIPDFYKSICNSTEAFNHWSIHRNTLNSAIIGTESILSYNLDSNDFSEIKTNISLIEDIYFIGEDLWATSLDGFAYKLQINGSVSKNYGKKCTTDLVIFNFMKDVFCFSSMGEGIYKLNSECDAYTILRNAKLLFIEKPRKEGLYGNYDIWDNKVIFFPPYQDELIVFDGEETSNLPIIFLEEDEKIFASKLILGMSQEIQYEGNYCSIEEYIRCLLVSDKE